MSNSIVPRNKIRLTWSQRASGKRLEITIKIASKGAMQLKSVGFNLQQRSPPEGLDRFEHFTSGQIRGEGALNMDQGNPMGLGGEPLDNLGFRVRWALPLADQAADECCHRPNSLASARFLSAPEIGRGLWLQRFAGPRDCLRRCRPAKRRIQNQDEQL